MEEENKRKGDWMCTFSGVTFWPLDPWPEEVFIVDIAHALANICRFQGHTKEFYSVAQHSIIVSQIVSPQNAFAGLLHDAAEAYVCDLIRPIKRIMGEVYADAERAVADAIGKKYGVDLAHLPQEVHDADNVVLATEKRDLMRTSKPWGPMPEPLEDKIVAWDPYYTEQMFTEMFMKLAPNLKGVVL